MKTKKRRIFDIIQIGQREDLISRLFDYSLALLIIFSCAIMFLDTFEEFRPYKDVFQTIEILSLFLFLLEYLLRIWTAEFLYPNLSKQKAVLRYIFSFDGIVELLTILPIFFLSGFVIFRLLRVVRIFHLFRINMTYDSFHVITTVLVNKKNQIASSVFIIVTMILASSLCMYSVEHEVQPQVFKNAFSGIWWSISTILTIGYGDIYPITTLGRMMGIIIGCLGVGIVAIPTGIISAGFVEQYTLLAKQDNVLGFSTFISYLDETHNYIGKTINEIEYEYNISILAIVREGVAMNAVDTITLTENDQIVYQLNSH